MGRPRHRDLEALGETLRAGGDEADPLPGPAGGDEADSTLAHRRDHRLTLRPVGVDDRGAVLGQERREQPELRLEVGLRRAVVVEVVVAEIGEARRRQAYPVEAALLDAVRRGFHRQFGHAVAGEPVEGLVQGDRVGGRQRAVGRARGGDDAERAEARRLPAETAEDLAHEVGDRGLAAGAGDRDDGAGLARMQPGGGGGERDARVRHRQVGDRIGQVGRTRAFGHHRDRAGRRRLGGEQPAVGGGAGHRQEHEAGLDLAAVGGEAGHGKAGGSTGLRKKVAEGEAHRPSTWLT
jgi:hypothetical protein